MLSGLSTARLVGVAASTPAGARRAADRLGFERAYDDVAAMLVDPDVDVVHVCTPNATHAALTLAALEAGRPVICEKPLSTSVEDAERMQRTAAARGLIGTVPFVYRYHPMVREARSRVARGDLGVLLSVSGAYLQDWMLGAGNGNWRVDAARGGPSRAFADIGSHLCDLIEFVSADRIVRLSALTRSLRGAPTGSGAPATEDLAAVLVQLASGAVGTLLVSQVAPGRKNRLTLELAGDASALAFDQESPELLWVGRRDGNSLLLRDPDTMAADAARVSTLPAGHPMGYQDAFGSFVDDSYALIRGEARDGVPMFSDGVRAVRVTEAVLAAAQSGGWVDVPDEADGP